MKYKAVASLFIISPISLLMVLSIRYIIQTGQAEEFLNYHTLIDIFSTIYFVYMGGLFLGLLTLSLLLARSINATEFGKNLNQYGKITTVIFLSPIIIQGLATILPSQYTRIFHDLNFLPIVLVLIITTILLPTTMKPQTEDDEKVKDALYLLTAGYIFGGIGIFITSIGLSSFEFTMIANLLTLTIDIAALYLLFRLTNWETTANLTQDQGTDLLYRQTDQKPIEQNNQDS